MTSSQIKMYELLKNFLTDRKQRVVLNGQTSTWENVNSGVPQGSVLAATLSYVHKLLTRRNTI